MHLGAISRNTDRIPAGTSVANIPSPPQSDTTRTDPEQLMYIALSFGFSLCINVWIFFRISGGLFNPVVTLGLLLIGALSGTRAAVIFLAQIVASIVSAVAVNGLFPTPLAVSTSLGVGTTLAQGVFIEAFLTFELVFCIFMLAAEKHKATFLAPIGIGLALFVAELAGVYYTGGSLNPARSFGPAVAARSFPKEHWIYWVGPALGALAAVGFYKFVKKLDYEEANPGQDRDPEETVVTVRNATSGKCSDRLMMTDLVLTNATKNLPDRTADCPERRPTATWWWRWILPVGSRAFCAGPWKKRRLE